MVALSPALTVRVDNVSRVARRCEIHRSAGRINVPGKIAFTVQAGITNTLGFAALENHGERCCALYEAIRVSELETGADIHWIGRNRRHRHHSRPEARKKRAEINAEACSSLQIAPIETAVL